MLRPWIPAALLLLSLNVSGFGQVINASLSGTVSDVTGALIPGVSVAATQTATGVVSTAVTNESGTYRFPSLQPGPYEVHADLPGFQSQIFRVTLGTAQQIRQNFTLQVGGIAQEVEVSVAPDQLLTTQSSSVGGALAQTQVVALPLVGRNVMDIATRIVPGVSGDGQANTTFAGITVTGAGNVGIQMDGVTMNAGRHTHGLATPLSINPDMVDEIRVVVAAVDAEGRGSAQVQMRTRSGSNQLHGGVTWNVRNSALNANTWSSNRQGIAPVWYNRHQYTASLGGPIVRNRTFFFGLFDGQDGQQRQNVDALVLTDTARQGIFRFFPGVNNGHAETTVSGTGNTRIAPVVDLAGNPRDWTQIAGATGTLQSFNVFGDAGNAGDPFRRQMDRTGFIGKLLGYMPHANAFNGQGDGLNTAVHRWVRRTVAGAAGFTGENADALLRGLNIGSGVIGTAISGSEALRRHASFRTNIATGNFAAVARTLNTTNIGTVQPRGQIIGGTMRSSGLFPENFFVVNPQFNNVTYRNNSDSSNYHSMQAQVTMRPTAGVSFQGTYTWSRSLGISGGVNTSGGFNGNYRDLLNMRADYGLQATHRAHDFRTFGSFELPFGPGKPIANGSSGWFARVVEGWQVGTILNLSSGTPLSVAGTSTLYNLGTPDITGAFPREGKVVWPLNQGSPFGNFFGQQYQRVPDPDCSAVASVLTVWCTNTALADANGNIVLRNAAPGQLGTLGLATIEGPGSWDLDANIQKTLRIAESRNLIFRVDARNLFNHPNPGNPNLNINSGTFGEINSKTGSRTLAAQVRIEF